MPRLKSTVSGAIVSVSDETAKRLDSEWEAVEEADSEPEGYRALKVPELEAEIDKRNEGREEADRIAPEGTKKADLIAALEADDANTGDNK